MKTMLQDIKDIKERKRKSEGGFQKFFKKFGFAIIILFVLISQVALLSAFEAHIINVTARICIPLETRTPGYWKTHPEVYEPLLPQTLGDETVNTVEEAFDILDSDAVDMRDKLKSHLLAMKFNIVYFGVGDYFVESCNEIPINKTINELVAEADALLRNPDATREELEAIKNKLDCINNLHELRECATPSILLNLFNTNVQIEISNEITTDEGEQIIIPESTEGQTEEETPPPEEQTPSPEEVPPSEETPLPEETPTSEETPPVEETPPPETPPSEETPQTEETLTTEETLPEEIPPQEEIPPEETPPEEQPAEEPITEVVEEPTTEEPAIEPIPEPTPEPVAE